MKRNIIEIDEEKCVGCGLCIMGCDEGALQIIDGKAKLVSNTYCDGLGDCIGTCPMDALHVVQKDVDEFDYAATNKHLKDIGRDELKHNPLDKKVEKKHSGCSCPGSAVHQIKGSSLKQWPVQISLLPVDAPFFDGFDLLIAADCVGFAYPEMQSLMESKTLLVGCPMLDNISEYEEKFKAIFTNNDVKSVTVAMMEVPCCRGLLKAVEFAVEASGKNVLITKIIIGKTGVRK
ncbi:MAG: 4Fe-4S binding protein [Nanoarchaeota archaeon]|nr:4Fe-4S binding protein [Nanoarchaeota archaeon]